MKITERGSNTIAPSFDAAELFVIVNALEAAAQTVDPDEEVAHKRVQRPLVEALQHLRPKAHLSDGRWSSSLFPGRFTTTELARSTSTAQKMRPNPRS